MFEKIVIVVFIIELIVFFHIENDIEKDAINAEKQVEIITPKKEEKITAVEKPAIEEEVEINEEVKKVELSEEEKRPKKLERKQREEKRLQEEIDDVCPYAKGFYDAEGILEEFEGLYFDDYSEVEDFVEQYCKID